MRKRHTPGHGTSQQSTLRLLLSPQKSGSYVCPSYLDASTLKLKFPECLIFVVKIIY